MDFGSILGGMAQGANSDIQARRNMALGLKMRSLLAQQELQNQMSLQQNQAGIEQSRFQREQVAHPSTLGALQAMGQRMGMNVGPFDQGTTNQEADILSHGLSNAAWMRMLSLPAGSQMDIDPTTGVRRGVVQYNANGTPLKEIHYPDATSKINKVQQLQQFVGNWNTASDAYDRLSMPGGGVLGEALNKVADLSGGAGGLADRNFLDRQTAGTAIQAGEVLDQLPGGRASLGLGAMSKRIMIGASMSPAVKKNVNDNVMF